MRLKQTMVLPGIKGRIDHMAYNDSLQQIYVGELGNNTVWVVDLRQGKIDCTADTRYVPGHHKAYVGYG